MREHGATKNESEEESDDEKMPLLEDCSNDGIENPVNGGSLVARQTLNL